MCALVEIVLRYDLHLIKGISYLPNADSWALALNPPVETMYYI